MMQGMLVIPPFVLHWRYYMDFDKPFLILHLKFNIVYKVEKDKECYSDRVRITRLSKNNKRFIREGVLISHFKRGNIAILPKALEILHGLKNKT